MGRYLVRLLVVGVTASTVACGDDATEPDLTAALVAVTAGSLFSCGLTADGQAFCWGWNRDGQLGNGRTSDESVPVAVSGNLRFTMISSGGGHTCGLVDDGTAYCWGLNQSGQLGIGQAGASSSAGTPVAVATDLKFDHIAAGGAYTCGVSTTGDGYCWGWNETGQLGNGDQTDQSSPALVGGGVTFAAMYGGAFHTCGVAVNGDAYCWGRNTDGQLGDDGSVPATTPVAVTGGLAFEALALGFEHTCGLTLGGVLYCWGNDDVGQMGNGGAAPAAVPTAVMSGVGFAAVASGARYSCGAQTAGVAFCWGVNQAGQLGSDAAEPCIAIDPAGNQGTVACATEPEPVQSELLFSAISAQNQHTCAIAVSGGAYCWGFGETGQLGDGNSGTNYLQTRPVRVLGQP